MREFFKPWKRKAGCSLLFVASVLMIGWIRSNVFCDEISTPFKESTYFIESKQGRLQWGWIREADPRFRQTRTQFFSMRMTKENTHDLREYYDLNPSWRWVGFWIEAGHSKNQPGTLLSDWEVPYWSVTLPAALLSGYLLLWPSRRQRPNANTPPKSAL